MTGSSIAVVVLAAGASTRLGRPKQLVRLADGRTLLRHAVEAALDAAVGPVFVVLGACAEPCHAELAGLDVTVVDHRRWEDGQGSSLAAGLRAARTGPEPDAVIVMVCDQPGIRAAHLRALAESFRRGARAAAAEYAGVTGVPALFARDLFPELANVPPHTGARDLLARIAPDVRRIPAPELAQDVDTAADAGLRDAPD